jgi:ribosomal protein S18 acetylase RimI-like enzyme
VADPLDLVFSLTQAPLPAQAIEEIQGLVTSVFESLDPDVPWRIVNMPAFTVFEARSAGVLVGFKMGYAHARRRYYSWLGGVHPDFRHRGIARRLMTSQHRWLTEQGYTSVETSARDDNIAMIQLNLSSSFGKVGTRPKDGIATLCLKNSWLPRDRIRLLSCPLVATI